MRNSFILTGLGLCLSLLFSCKSNQELVDGHANPKIDNPRQMLLTQEQASNVYIEASTELIRGEYGQAEQLFKEVLSLDPHNHAAQYNLAKIALEARRNDEALEYIQAAIEEHPDNYWYHFLMRQIFERGGEYRKAIEVQEEMLARFEDVPDDRLHLVSMYLREDQQEKALTQLEHLDKTYGFNPIVARRRYEILDDLGEREAALAEARRLLDFDPLENRYYRMAYLQLQELGREDEAKQLLEDLLLEDPDNGFALLSLADYYKGKNQLAKSDEFLFRAFNNPEIQPDGKLKIIRGLMAYTDRDAELRGRVMRLVAIFLEVHPEEAGGHAIQGKLALQDGRLDDARGYFRQSLDLEPGNIDGWADLIRLSLLAREYSQMLDDAEEARSYFPNQDEILFFYGFAAARTGKYRPATSALEKILRKETASPELMAQTHAELAYVYHQQGDFAASDQNFGQALQLSPDNPMILGNHAYLLAERSERLPEAKEMAEKALKTQGQDPNLLDTYAWVLYHQGDYRGARKQLEKALKLATTPQILEHYGDVLYQLGEKEAAETQWQKAIDGGASFLLDEKKSEFK